MKKYGVLNPTNGTYQKFDTQEQAISAALTLAYDFYLLHTHNQPFADITINDDGSETWASFDGAPMLSPEQIEKERKKFEGHYQQSEEHLRSFTEAKQLQITRL